MGVVNKKELIKEIAGKTSLPKGIVAKVTDQVLEAIICNLEKQNQIKLAKFATFEVRWRTQRKGVDPRSKKEIWIDSVPIPVFRAGTVFKRRIRESHSPYQKEIGS